MEAKFKEMVATQPTMSVEELGGVTATTLVLVSDDDMVTLDHTVGLYRAIPNSEPAVVPETSHLVAMEEPELVNRLVLAFLQKDPVPTYMPPRRAADGANQERQPSNRALNIPTNPPTS